MYSPCLAANKLQVSYEMEFGGQLSDCFGEVNFNWTSANSKFSIEPVDV